MDGDSACYTKEALARRRRAQRDTVVQRWLQTLWLMNPCARAKGLLPEVWRRCGGGLKVVRRRFEGRVEMV